MTEPVGAKYMEGYPQLKEMMQKAGWLNFNENFDGFHEEITKYFARSFDGTEVEIGDVKFAVTESYIIEATKLPRHGEIWLKNKEFHSESWKVILRNPDMDVSVFIKGILISALKSKWRNMLLILQKFIPYEGRFRCMYVYHIHLLMNFLENGEINLPFLLLNSLRRMASNVQKKIEFIDTTMYHHGLVKILVEYNLKRIGDTWENFLIRNYFQEAPESAEEGNFRRNKRKKIGITIQRKPESSTQKNDEELVSKKLIEIREPIKQKGKMKKKAGETTGNKPESLLQQDDENLISENLTEIRKQIKRKEKIGNEKKGTKEENISPLQLRRSSRLRGMVNKISSKGTEFIYLEEETPTPSLDNVPSAHSPQNSPEQYFEGSPSRRSPGMDPMQQQIYDHIESLEKKSASMDPESSVNP